MADKTDTRELIFALSENANTEDMMLSTLQALIAAKISMKRQDLGLSQKAFADAMGVSQTLVSRWESGDCNFTLKTLVSIAVKLDIEMEVPFRMEAPNIYSFKNRNVRLFPERNAWRFASSHATTQTYITTPDEELKEN